MSNLISDLNTYYDILLKEEKVTEYGFDKVPFSACIVINTDGDIVTIENFKNDILMIVPQKRQRSGSASYKVSNLLYDNKQHTLGLQKDKNGDAICLNYFESFKNYNVSFLTNVKNIESNALINFLNKYEPSLDIISTFNFNTNNIGNICFKLNETNQYLHDNKDIINFYKNIMRQELLNVDEDKRPILGTSIISGENNVLISKTHKSITTIGGQSFGNKLISYNFESPTSYGYTNKHQAFNSPLSIDEVYKYATTLNYLTSNKQYIMNGDEQIYYWAIGENKLNIEQLFKFSFKNNNDKFDDETTNSYLKNILDNLFKGKYIDIERLKELDSDIHILVLQANSARTVVKYYLVENFINIFTNMAKHFKDCTIEGLNYPLSVYSMIMAGTRKGAEYNKLNPKLKEQVLLSMLHNTQYPSCIFESVITRFKIDYELNKIAVMRGYLIRKGYDIKMALDKENENINYKLGRMFAFAVQSQWKAQGDLNSNMEQKLFKSMCENPCITLSVVMQKLIIYKSNPKASWYVGEFEKLLGDIGVNIPKRATLEQQALFCIGYAQQKQEFYKLNINNVNDNENNNKNNNDNMEVSENE